jgi:ATP-dependent DNA helicase RecG
MQNGKENIENNTLQFIKGVGPKRAEALIKEGILTPLDLLYYFPRAYIDRTGTKTLYSLVSELKIILRRKTYTSTPSKQ